MAAMFGLIHDAHPHYAGVDITHRTSVTPSR